MALSMALGRLNRFSNLSDGSAMRDLRDARGRKQDF